MAPPDRDWRHHAVDLGWSREAVLRIAEEVRGLRGVYRATFADVRAFPHLIVMEVPGWKAEWLRPGVAPVVVPPVERRRAYAPPRKVKADTRQTHKTTRTPVKPPTVAKTEAERKRIEFAARQTGMWIARRG